jgi:hypothetical protein
MNQIFWSEFRMAAVPFANLYYFFAWKDGCLIAASKTREEAMEAFVWREKFETK